MFLLFYMNSNVMAQSNSCAAATLIVSDSTCKAGGSQLSGSLSGATYTAGDIGSTTSICTFVASQDVWYRFQAKSQYPNIALSNLGSNFFSNGTSPTQIGLKMQLFSGSCGSFTEIGCGNNSTPITLTPLNTALMIGNFYYIRVHLDKVAAATPSGANWGFNICVTDQISKASRMNEIFSRTYLSGAGVLNFPWEIAYGPDDSLWVTESKGYRVYKMNSINGGKRTVLDLNNGSTWFGAPGGADTLYAQQVVSSWSPSPQGGLAGLALHPDFGKGLSRDWVYITYVWRFISNTNPNGAIFQNKLVRFTYVGGRLQDPRVIEARLPGSSDHNSQRLTIAPVVKNGTPFLFMGQGDMGAGQFYNRYRPNNSQDSFSVEGKVLRYNLDTVGQPGVGVAKWLPISNPFASNRAIYSIGLRNTQGFAYDTATNILYSSSHGPYSDDEINIIDKFKNYGHPLVVGFAADGNYNGTSNSGTDTSVTAGAPYTDGVITWYYPNPGYTPTSPYTSPYLGQSSNPPIGNENTNKNTMNTNALKTGAYQDPLFSAYPSSRATIRTNWQTNPGNGGWESEGWSGLDLYSNKIIPGWNRSLVASGLKWGRLIKINLGTTGTTTMPSNVGGSAGNVGDTITYFQSSNRYRDIAFSPNGKDIFVVMDNSSATSGPGTANPSAAGCPGCVIKYTFLGYDSVNVAPGVSRLPKSIGVTDGPVNTCNAGTIVTIDATNNALWVPITGPDGNILAEINAMGQNLGVVTSSFYKHSGTVRNASGVRYLDRNITITPAVTGPYATPVKVRLYISKAELDAIIAVPASGVTSIINLQILKNNDPCSAVLSSSTTSFLPTNTLIQDLQHGANGYVLQTAVSSFSSFYFAANNIVLPVDLTTFNGSLQSNLSTLLKWKTENEINTKGFELERSVDGNNFKQITFVHATGNNNGILNYSFTDNDAIEQLSNILYYRLKIINKDGSFNYSNIIAITLPITKASISIVPNPVFNDVKGNIVSPITGNVMLRIFDNTGRIIFQNNMVLKKGNNNFIQNVGQLSKGIYYIEITGKGITSRTQFQKL